jgi:hypothetical protein
VRIVVPLGGGWRIVRSPAPVTARRHDPQRVTA